MRFTSRSIILVSSAALISCGSGNNTESISNNDQTTVLSYNILNVFPHDTTAFTEGLVWYNGYLFESTGLEKKSTIRKIDLKNGTIIKEIKIADPVIFGEGITIFRDSIYQLTYQNKIAFVYDLNNFKRIKSFVLPFAEGWGITHDSLTLIISDGSNRLYFVDPDSFRVAKTVYVTNAHCPMGNINELEFVNGFVYANVWQTNKIIKIDPADGKVVASLDLTGIIDKAGVQYLAQKIDVLNGIAYNSLSNTFLITGKYWPAIFEIQIF